MRRRVVAALPAAFVLLGVLPPARAAVPVARGTTVVTASRTAKTSLYVPTRSTVTATVSGSGRLIGAILREQHEQPDEAVFLRAAGDSFSPPGDVRKGVYSVYLVTDGPPVRVTFRFAKLSGSTSLTASGKVASGTSRFQTSIGASVSWSAGTGIQTPGPADIFTLATWQQDDSLYAESGGCSYDGSNGIEALGQYRWLPGCPGGFSGGFSEVRNPTQAPGPTGRGGRHAIVGRDAASAAGTYGEGVWVEAQNVRDGDGFVVWVGR